MWSERFWYGRDIQARFLVFCIDVFENNVTKPSTVFEIELSSNEHIFEVVEGVATFLSCVPIIASSVAVVIEEKHG